MDYKIIITGTTGMVGEGVLIECLEHPQVSKVLSVSRKPTGMSHPKLKEYIVPNFLELEVGDDNLRGYDACFFCAGVSSIGMNEADYTKATYATTLHFANALLPVNPHMTFVYVSGASTDSSEKGGSMWARVKGKTENALMQLPFQNVFNFRPGFMKLTPGQKNALPFYTYVGWMFPILKVVMPNGTSTLKQVGQAMINCLLIGSEKQILEVKDINALGNR